MIITWKMIQRMMIHQGRWLVGEQLIDRTTNRTMIGLISLKMMTQIQGRIIRAMIAKLVLKLVQKFDLEVEPIMGLVARIHQFEP